VTLEVLEELEALDKLEELHALEACVPGSDHLLSFDCGRLARQLDAFLGPRLSREDVRCLTFSFANVMMQLVKPMVRIAITSLSATSPCSWPILREHGWSTFSPTRFKVGRT